MDSPRSLVDNNLSLHLLRMMRVGDAVLARRVAMKGWRNLLPTLPVFSGYSETEDLYTQEPVAPRLHGYKSRASSSATAGPWSTVPSISKREP
jgi:hypothetical protein